MKVHPVADLFPMLADDELAELAADIKQRGLIHPIVLDGPEDDGWLLDGRNRLAACELAGIKPTFERYDGSDPIGYILATNINRRHLTKGQQAMIIAASDDKNYQAYGISRQYVSWARTVLVYAESLKLLVIAGARTLKDAYDEALKVKQANEGVEAQLARLRAEDPELADKVVEGELTLPGAWAERKARVEEDQRRRRVATHLLCEHVLAVAQIQGTTNVIPYYDPAEALPGRAVTRQAIADAMAVLEQMADVWKERELP